MTAGRVQPCDSDPVSFLQVCDPGTECSHDASTFMTWDERESRFHRPITVGRVQIGMTHSGRADFHQCLPWSGRGGRSFWTHQGRAEVFDDRRFHRLRDGHSLLLTYCTYCARPCATTACSAWRTSI